MALGVWFRFLAKCLFILVLLIFCVQYWLEKKSYLIDEQIISSIAGKHAGTTNIGLSYKQILKAFRQKYPGHILKDEHLQWIFMNAGGWMGSMCLLHASLTEYVLFFGTAVDTAGHSGRYWANISDTILTGTFRQWREGELQSVLHKPGETVFHGWGEVTAVAFSEGTWMVEYGRGFIPSTLGFALSDTLFGTQDFVTMFYVFRAYTRALLLEASNGIIKDWEGASNGVIKGQWEKPCKGQGSKQTHDGTKD